MKITITKHLRVEDATTPLIEELMEALSLPNPKWLENERMGRWNRGTPKLLKFYFKIKNGLIIPRGYMRQLINTAGRHDEDYEIVDERRVLAPADFHFNGELKPFQEQAVDVMMSKDFGLLCSPTGSGKTVMALYMIAQRNQPAIIVVHTKDLAFQWIDRIETFLDIPKDEVGLIGAGKKTVGEKLTVALVQTLYKCADEVAPSIGFLIVDESHRCPSRTFTDAVTEFDSKYMLGLSATPWRRDKLTKLIFFHLGDQHHEVDKGALIQSGDVLPAEVVVRETEFKPFYDPTNEYTKMITELIADKDRNLLIAEDVAQQVQKEPGVCLVLSDRKEHCKNLHALISLKHKLECELLTGDQSTEERRQILDRLNRGEVNILIATGALIGEGFDHKALSTLFLVTPISFSGRVLQYLGRVLRPAPGKEIAKVFDYVDIHVGPLKAAAKARQRAYGIGG